MNEPWETSLYPIIKNYLMSFITEDERTDDEINALANCICHEIDRKYIIEKR